MHVPLRARPWMAGRTGVGRHGWRYRRPAEGNMRLRAPPPIGSNRYLHFERPKSVAPGTHHSDKEAMPVPIAVAANTSLG